MSLIYVTMMMGHITHFLTQELMHRFFLLAFLGKGELVQDPLAGRLCDAQGFVRELQCQVLCQN